MSILRFDLESFTDAVFLAEPEHVNSGAIHASEWNGHCNFTQAKELVKSGSEEYGARIQALLDKVDDIELPESFRYRWSADVAGAYPSVPAYVAGHPLNMRSRKLTLTDTAPIRIFITTIIPAWCEGPVMSRRFAAIVALVMKLQLTRAVELHCVCSTSDGTSGDPADIQDILIPSTPISLAHAGMVSHPAFTRCLQYALAIKLFGCPTNIPIARKCEPYIMARLGVTENDLYLPLVDRQDIIMTNPEEWIRLMVARFLDGSVKSLGWKPLPNQVSQPTPVSMPSPIPPIRPIPTWKPKRRYVSSKSRGIIYLTP